MNKISSTCQTIRIEGITYTKEQILDKPSFAQKSDFHHTLHTFLLEWFDHGETIKLQTSGSTGIPQKMMVNKEQMVQSAIQTCHFLDLKEGDKTLLCMPLDYIAGKMIVVRSLYAGLDLYLVEPSGHPLEKIDIPFDFAAMVPLQVFNSIHNGQENERLKSIKKLIIGGGAIDSTLEMTLHNFPNQIYSTYGMSETLSHIALRRLNGTSASKNYYPLGGINLSLSEDDCLIIDAPSIAKGLLFTNDIAKIYDDGSFCILGRKDNVVNSGGIKIQLEEVEEKLAEHIQYPFALTSCEDSKFGEILVLIAEKFTDLDNLKAILPPYHLPKKMIVVNHIPMTETSKIDRVALKCLAIRASNSD